MRYTPIYRLPALEGSSTAKEVYEQSWATALELERVLLNTGQMPIGADLQSLLKRVSALETGAGPKIGGTMIRSTADKGLVTGAWNPIMDPSLWQPEQPLSGIDWDGRMTVKTDGMYQLSLGVKLDATSNCLFAAQKNTTTPGVGFVIAGSAAGTASYTAGTASKPIPLKAGDKLGMTVFTSVATGLSNNQAEKASTFMALQYLEPIRTR